MDFGLKNIVDIQAFSAGLNKTLQSNLGLIIPIIATEYVRTFAQGAINVGGGNMGMLANGAISAAIKVWEINMVVSG